MGRVIPVFLLIAVFLGGLFYLKREEDSLISPIPRVFGTAKAQVLNNWFPKNTLFGKYKSDGFALLAKSAILVDYDTSEVIFKKNENERLPVASTVKIMTALVALENADLEGSFTVSEKAAKIGENAMGLTVGERLTVEELLYGLMLVSGNDASVTLAEGIAGSEENFVGMMNEKVKSLGLTNTKFANATGLEEDSKEQYSTASDLATIAHYTWENYPEFRKISSTINKFIEATQSHKALDLYNDTNLLTTYPGVLGIKPGFTPEAGLCLVTYAENEDKKLIGVILGSSDRRGEMKELLDFGFSYFGITVSHPALD